MKKLIIGISILFFFSTTAKAQQEKLVSQYTRNYLLLNPAYAGSKNFASAALLYRNQWTQIEGAPVSQVISVHAPFFKNRVGAGFLLTHDHIGVTDRTDMFASYAYHIPINRKTNLGVGVQAGGSYYSAKYSDLILWDPNDHNFTGNLKSDFLPNFGLGIYLYHHNYFAGLSVPAVLSYDPSQIFNNNGDRLVLRQVRHYYASGGAAFELDNDIVLKPTALIKYAVNAPIEADLNMSVLLKKMIWLGVGYRTGAALVAMGEFQINKKFKIGYSYDFTVSKLSNYAGGSHEIMIGYDFGYNILKNKKPSFF